jgi:N-acetylglucosamine kinase-like BadF-type ATPase
MRDFLLGIDVGGSRTRALVSDAEGRALGYGEAGAGNHETVGYEGLYSAMESALSAALAAAGLPRVSGAGKALAGGGFGVAGFDWESERKETSAAIAKLGLDCPIELRVDAALGLAAGSEAGWGLNLVAGTSNNCYGLSPDGREGRIAGASSLLGEHGGAAEIAGKALIAVNHARIKRTGPTALSEVLCGLTGMATSEELIEAAGLGRLEPDAAWAPAVFEAARGGDEAARNIIDWAGRELGESAAAVVRQLGLEAMAFDVILSGSLFGYEPKLEAGLAPVLLSHAPGAVISHLAAPPVVGAVLLGAAAAGLSPGGRGRPAMRERLLETTASLLRGE